MNGMFTKLSMLELRSTQQVCGSQCSTFGCYKDSGVTPVTFGEALSNEGQATGGSPLYSHPAQLQEMNQAGQILPVFAKTLGYSGANLPTLTWSLDVAQFLQGVTLPHILHLTSKPVQNQLESRVSLNPAKL